MDKVRQWTVFTGLAVVIVFVAGWMLAISPQRSHAADLRDQAASQRQQADSLRIRLASLRARSADLPKKQARLAEIQAMLPNSPALPALIRQLSDAADSAGVELTSLAPAAPAAVVAGAAAPQTAAKAAPGTTAAAGALEQIAVSIDVKGSFFNLEQFESNLEHLDRALIVDGFTMTAPGASASAPAAPSGHGATKDDRMTATIQARVFMVPEASPVTAATATKTTAQPAQ